MNGNSGRVDVGTLAPNMPNSEAGATDNRMYLDPNDPQWADVIDGWEDGSEYTFKKVRVRQESQGQFTILSAEAGEVAEQEVEEAGEGATAETPRTGAMGRAGGGYTNPSVEKMLASRASGA